MNGRIFDSSLKIRIIIRNSYFIERTLYVIDTVKMVLKCGACSKSETKKRKIVDNICSDCTAMEDNNNNVEELDLEQMFDEEFLNTSLTTLNVFGLASIINTLNSKTLIPEITKITSDMKAIKTDLANTKKELANAKGEIVTLKATAKTLEDELKVIKDTSKNNLRYLINHDRNVRSQNVLIFGIPEKTNIDTGNGTTAYNDKEKVSFVFKYIKGNEHGIKSIFRLGKEGEKPRPIKVILNSRENAKDVLTKSIALKEYKEQVIYIKPDKSKSEQQEFARLGKRKKDLLDQNPTNIGEVPRVKLEKGILTLDGIEVDRYKSVQSIF